MHDSSLKMVPKNYCWYTNIEPLVDFYHRDGLHHRIVNEFFLDLLVHQHVPSLSLQVPHSEDVLAHQC
ncbi:hypothetical protein BT93_F2177 [Corymbia citriodora subsp. variegata]|nr:hypothetical protein BT93_F2177 [Corymbia citriodora subsp. variegata]